MSTAAEDVIDKDFAEKYGLALEEDESVPVLSGVADAAAPVVRTVKEAFYEPPIKWFLFGTAFGTGLTLFLDLIERIH